MLTTCEACGHRMSIEAAACPSCGQPNDPEWARAREAEIQRQEEKHRRQRAQRRQRQKQEDQRLIAKLAVAAGVVVGVPVLFLVGAATIGAFTAPKKHSTATDAPLQSQWVDGTEPGVHTLWGREVYVFGARLRPYLLTWCDERDGVQLWIATMPGTGSTTPRLQVSFDQAGAGATTARTTKEGLVVIAEPAAYLRTMADHARLDIEFRSVHGDSVRNTFDLGGTEVVAAQVFAECGLAFREAEAP